MLNATGPIGLFLVPMLFAGIVLIGAVLWRYICETDAQKIDRANRAAYEAHKKHVMAKRARELDAQQAQFAQFAKSNSQALSRRAAEEAERFAALSAGGTNQPKTTTDPRLSGSQLEQRENGSETETKGS